MMYKSYILKLELIEQYNKQTVIIPCYILNDLLEDLYYEQEWLSFVEFLKNFPYSFLYDTSDEEETNTGEECVKFDLHNLFSTAELEDIDLIMDYMKTCYNLQDTVRKQLKYSNDDYVDYITMYDKLGNLWLIKGVFYKDKLIKIISEPKLVLLENELKGYHTN